MALEVNVWKHLLKQVMGHINAINDALTTTTARAGGGFREVTAAANPLTAADINGTVAANSADANTVTIPDGLMAAGDRVTVIQIGAGATSIAKVAAATLNGAGDAIAVGDQYAVMVVHCIAEDTYVVAPVLPAA